MSPIKRKSKYYKIYSMNEFYDRVEKEKQNVYNINLKFNA